VELGQVKGDGAKSVSRDVFDARFIHKRSPDRCKCTPMLHQQGCSTVFSTSEYLGFTPNWNAPDSHVTLT
jgi:hypothetical protein